MKWFGVCCVLLAACGGETDPGATGTGASGVAGAGWNQAFWLGKKWSETLGER